MVSVHSGVHFGIKSRLSGAAEVNMYTACLPHQLTTGGRIDRHRPEFDRKCELQNSTGGGQVATLQMEMHHARVYFTGLLCAQ